MKDLTDEHLMLLFKAGNNSAFRVLFEKYRNRIFRYVYNLFGRNRHLSEDITQEVFLKVIANRHAYNPESKFSTWLYAVTRNLCINRMKSRGFRDEKATYALDAVAAVVPSTEPDPGSNIETAELGKVIRKALAELPANYKEVFILRELDGLRYDEIGRILGTNQETIRTRFHRARRLLQEKIKPYLEG